MRPPKKHLPRLMGSLCIAASALLASDAWAFNQAAPYHAGSIKPNHLSQAVMDQQLTRFYKEWKALYLSTECGNDRYFIKVNADGKPVGGGTAPHTITVSEAHGYGMLLSVMMAEQDPDAQKIFDGMVRYFKDHPAKSDPGLMAWNQVEGCGNSTGKFRGKTRPGAAKARLTIEAKPIKCWRRSCTMRYTREPIICCWVTGLAPMAIPNSNMPPAARTSCSRTSTVFLR
jgi:hypothetical protein